MGEQQRIKSYLELEQESDIRHELINGEVYAMAGTTVEHDIICNNLIKLLQDCLMNNGCTLLTGQVKLYTPACQKSFLYPDLHIYCGSLEKEKLSQGAYALKSPRFIIEVLSRKTREYDFKTKFACYRQIPSLEGYLLVESDLEKQAPGIYWRSWGNSDAYQEQKFDLEDEIGLFACPIILRDVYNLPDF